LQAPDAADDQNVRNFVRRWEASGAAERANYTMFLTELCDLLHVPRPDPTRPDDRDNAYVFERSVPMDDGDGHVTIGRIDLYKRGCFVLEAKQGATVEEGADLFALDSARSRTRRGTAVRGTVHWDVEMKKAKGQAERYRGYLPAHEGNPPFILVVDVGHIIEVYADFSRLGKTYTPFPDSLTYRIALRDLADAKIRKRLALIFTDPLSLDPTRHSAKVTREIAEKLAKLAKSFESAGHHPEVVAGFLMRCLFTFFAEDVGLIDLHRAGEQPFTELLKSLRGHLDQFIPMTEGVWSQMDKGGFSQGMRRKLKQFNGKLFKEFSALPVNEQQLELLIKAGESDWSDVEPAIFGTLLERALEPRERHKLGAHYTPRAYVERLVLPTVIEPLREKWDAARAAAFTLNMTGKNDEARKAVHDFLADLCSTIVLDPACGSANFLYVTMEHMKKLEGEAREELRQLGETQELLERAGLTVDPHQFLGLELNPRAVAIAELVLWIGYLKWHLRTLGHAPNEPLLKDFHNIVEQDAVLAYDRKELVTDESGKPVSRWDGHTMKVSPVTGEEIPDEAARVPVYRYVNPRKAEWPKADYVVGNPPFIGNKRMRLSLGDGYASVLRETHSDIGGSADFVMYWWNHAAKLLLNDHLRRFGFITTNSITQSFNRKVVDANIGDGRSIVYAIPDHPWVDSADGAAVRVAMTVVAATGKIGRLCSPLSESPSDDGAFDVQLATSSGIINADLTIGTNRTEVTSLKSNAGMAFTGMYPLGQGFVISAEDERRLNLPTPKTAMVVKPYLTARDLAQRSRSSKIIDFYPLSQEDARDRFTALFQWVLERVKPERDQNPVAERRRNWWLFTRPIPALRRAIAPIHRFIAVPRTAKYFTFQFVPSDTIVDTTVVAIAVDDALNLAILSSRIHRVWALNSGGTLEDRPRYQHQETFDPFPFPAAIEAQKSRIRVLGESLDAHRKRQQALHPKLTITDMYNVLEKLRKNEELTPWDRLIHEQGLVSVLRQIHDDLDTAVADAYGWPADLSDEEILRRLVALNAERAEEEKRGLIRWLRPDFQNPTGAQAAQGTLGLQPAAAAGKAKEAEKLPWPKSLAEQAQSVRAALAGQAKPATAAELSKQFKGAKTERVGELLATLAALGQARTVAGDRFVA
jgi:hypothetical protein